jgi:hypothetical protein
MKLKTLSLAVIAVSILASCNGGKKRNLLEELSNASNSADSAKNAPAVAITYQAMFDKSNQDKNVIVEGYLALPSTSYMSDESTQLDFYERKGMFWSKESITLNMPVGSGKNTMKKMPLSYSADDMQVTTEDGTVVSVDAHIRVTGHLSTYGTLDVTKVEALKDDQTDFTKLQVTHIDASNPPSSALEGKLVSAEGTLDIPMSTLDGNYTWLYLHIKGIEDGQIIHIKYGDKPNQIEPLQDGYGEDDFKVHAKDGTLVGKKKIRVYGVYDSDAIKVEQIEIL